MCDIQLGKMLSPASKRGIRSRKYLRNANVQWGRFDLDDVAEMDFTEEQEAKFSLRNGDVMVCEGGEPGRAAVWHNEIEGCLYQKSLHRLRPDPGVLDSDFLAYRLRFGAVCGEFTGSHAKTTIAHLPAVRLAELRIGLPTLREQEHIVGALQQQLDAATRMRAAAHLSVDRARELEMTEAARMFLSEDASAWPVDALGGLLKTCSGLTPSRARSDFFGGDIPWVKTGELIDGTVTKTGEHVTETALAETSLRLLPVNTLLVAMYGQGQTRGRTGLLGIPSTTNQACFAILPRVDVVNPRFLQYWFRVNYERIREESEGRGGNQPNLNGVMLRQQRIPHPTIAIQRDVVGRLSGFRRSSEVVVDATITARDSAAQLSSSLLRRIFSHGE